MKRERDPSRGIHLRCRKTKYKSLHYLIESRDLNLSLCECTHIWANKCKAHLVNHVMILRQFCRTQHISFFYFVENEVSYRGLGNRFFKKRKNPQPTDHINQEYATICYCRLELVIQTHAAGLKSLPPGEIKLPAFLLTADTRPLCNEVSTTMKEQQVGLQTRVLWRRLPAPSCKLGLGQTFPGWIKHFFRSHLAHGTQVAGPDVCYSVSHRNKCQDKEPSLQLFSHCLVS